MQIDQDEATGTDSRADDRTQDNVSDQHTNDVGLQHPVVDVSQSSMFAIISMLFCCQYCS